MSGAAEVATVPAARVRVLCVDDEPNVLQGLSMVLRRPFDVVPAVGAAAGLEALRHDRQIAVIVSDMRMPGMDGAAFLREARTLAPDATRLLLTGQADIDSAIAAINEGRIFRFLTKPCPPPQLISAINAAVEQHRLVTAERVLLEQTLHGSIRMLTDVLGLVHPLAFGRAARIKQLVGELADKLQFAARWQVEIAAMLSQLRALALDAAIAEKLYYGQPLQPDEQTAVARAAESAMQLLANIPRMELVRAMLGGYYGLRPGGSVPQVYGERGLAETGAGMLRIAAAFDELEAQGNTAALAIDMLRMQQDRYPPELLQALTVLRAAAAPRRELRDLPFSALRPGMVFAQDITLANGVLIVPRGHEVTAALIERLRGLRPGACREPVRVVIPGA